MTRDFGARYSNCKIKHGDVVMYNISVFDLGLQYRNMFLP
ncbi:hypothetical protein HMPREF1147_2093 [Selenomonas sp. FOBRC9]|nr:hypothetical protein HMPREF1147_2093 [Selenomonas sp. FOBRC9]